MPPSLPDLGIQPGSYIRKLDNRNHWNGYSDDTDLTTASRLAAEKVFQEKGEKYSLWHVSTEQEFYGVVASLTANATPRDRNIDFISIAETELKEAGVKVENISEGACLRVKHLHVDARINPTVAQNLCYTLMSNQRKAQRCPKTSTISILEYQQQIGCRATNTSLPTCTCETG